MQKFSFSNFCSGRRLNPGPRSLMTVNVTTRLRRTPTAILPAITNAYVRSLERPDLLEWMMRTHFSDRVFSAAGPQCWNSLPPAIRLADSVDSFKAQLKTHLFPKAYPI